MKNIWWYNTNIKTIWRASDMYKYWYGKECCPRFIDQYCVLVDRNKSSLIRLITKMKDNWTDSVNQ